MEGLSLPERGVRLELFVRSSVPSPAYECQSSAIERLRTLDDTENIEGVRVRPWEKRVPLTEGTREPGSSREIYESLSEWAREHGANLQPFFETRECYSSVTGKAHTALVLPVTCLVVSKNERLHGVFPHATENRSYTVADALDALETATDRSVTPADAR